MSDQENKVDSTAAREAAMSRVVTAETILEQLTNATPATEEAPKEDASEAKEGEAKPKAKHTAQDRIRELAEKRKEAEAKASAAETELKELKERLKRLEQAPPAIEPADKPKREAFRSDDDYQEALLDWRADQRIAQREQQQRQAKFAEEAARIDADYQKSVKDAKSKYEDFDAVVKDAAIQVPDFIVMAIKENKAGGDITYYLSKHQDEAKEIFSMRPVRALEEILKLGNELTDEPDEKVKEPEAKPAKKKAPEPIKPLQGRPLTDPTQAKKFEDYRAQRMAAKRR